VHISSKMLNKNSAGSQSLPRVHSFFNMIPSIMQDDLAVTILNDRDNMFSIKSQRRYTYPKEYIMVPDHRAIYGHLSK